MKDDRLKLSISGGCPPIIKASGELDYENCDELGGLIRDALGGNSSTVVLALGELDFVDSSGLRTLVTTAQAARQAGGFVDIASLTPQISHMLEASGLKELFGSVSLPADRAGLPATAIPSGVITYCFEVTATPGACLTVRNNACDVAARAGFGSRALDDIRLAVGEAVSNAVKHGTQEGGPIWVRCRVEGGMLLITLTYPGDPFDPESVVEPNMNLLREGGMGIYFMRLAMDEVEYEFEDGYVTIKLKKFMEASHDPLLPG